MSIGAEQSKLKLAVGLTGALIVGILTAIALATGHDTVIYAVGTNIITLLVTWALTGGKRDELLKALDYIRTILVNWLQDEMPLDGWDVLKDYLPLLEMINYLISKHGKVPGATIAQMVRRAVEEALAEEKQ